MGGAVLLAVGLIGLSHVPGQPVAAISYRFRVTRDSNQQIALGVDLTLRGGASGVTRMKAPFRWAGEDSLRHGMSALGITPPARIVSDSADVLVIAHAPGATLHLTYTLRQDWSGPLRYPLYHRVVLDSARIIFNAANGLIFPAWDNARRIALRVQWEGIPPDWSVITSFGGANVAVPTTIGRLGEASFVAGRFRLSRGSPRSGAFVVAIQDHWLFPDSSFAALVERVWTRERRFWGDDGTGSGFVTLSRIETRGTQAGTAFTGGFVAVADSTSSLEAIGRLTAHELLHLWNGQGMRSAEPEGRYKWFTEGFTDWYADRFYHEAGGYSDSAWLGHVNAVIRRYYLSPVRGSTRNQVAEGYFSSASLKSYPYLQGYLLAPYLQAAFAKGSKGRFGFDDMMRRVYRVATSRNAPVSDSLMLAALPASMRSVMEEAIARFIEMGEVIPVAPGGLGPCFTVRDSSVVPFDLGFDVSRTTREKVARGVVPGGPAALAGLRDGDPLTGWGWFNDDPSRPATLRVRDGDSVRVLHYLPQAAAAVVVPQYRRIACGAALPSSGAAGDIGAGSSVPGARPHNPGGP